MIIYLPKVENKLVTWVSTKQQLTCPPPPNQHQHPRLRCSPDIIITNPSNSRRLTSPEATRGTDRVHLVSTCSESSKTDRPPKFWTIRARPLSRRPMPVEGKNNWFLRPLKTLRSWAKLWSWTLSSTATIQAPVTAQWISAIGGWPSSRICRTRIKGKVIFKTPLTRPALGI